ncbi:hypothetical protein VCHC80A1_01028 [Vibrio cholerae HC-80A1]|nr:hypothetical protein VCHC06A1_1359 [Vibrio cholerae HC-06A1]EHI02056.1 hypothetical protein VCHC33A2_1057 [Vibrio cholerae HC-33A2]EHI05706.1 hypothetical protein VCHC61A1_1895 [Vibrio cholerae HC-61A1]EKG91040.1 hypothetical protein VCHC81A2_1073 [Vibrio cholerae HC-81A2]ELT25438.1 hypothetical protein VCHC7A1_02098 [Vibrio cholerae HC-7A1]ELT33126.1 hypothetical protein VCHC80A1_01028 [Vibrio cholerae HC-80A1]EMQ39704.1 hypothetical protein VCEM1626_001093 [Vibrio cholerae O1 str. EM-162
MNTLELSKLLHPTAMVMVENNMVVLNKFIIYVLVYGVKTPAQGRRFY